MIINLPHKKKNLNFQILYSLVLGIFTSFSLPPYNYIFLNFITFSLLFLIIVNYPKRKKGFFFIGFFFGFGYFISSLYWITNSLTFIDEYKFLIPFALILIPSLLSFFYGAITLILYFFNLKKDFSSLFIFAIIFSIIEFLRGYIFTGFPWNLIVYSLSNYVQFIQVTSFIGTYSLNLICITLFLFPLFILFKLPKKIKMFFIIIFISIFISNHIFGQFRIDSLELATNKKLSKQIKIISPNINLKRFLKNEDPSIRIKEMIKLSKPDSNKNTLFVFPEGILNGINNRDLKYLSSYFLNNFSDNHHLVIGMNIEEGYKIYNSLVLFDNSLEPKEIYRKNNLVPFGEFLPLQDLLSKLGLKKITPGFKPFTSSDERKIISLGDFSFLPLVCYEIIYTGKLSRGVHKYDFIVNISEDGWFGDSIGPHQHFAHSIFRSVEEGKNLIRSSNNGISAFINPLGQIQNRIESTSSGVIEINTIKQVDPTIFSRHGNKIFFYFIIIYITLIFFLKKKGL